MATSKFEAINLIHLLSHHAAQVLCAASLLKEDEVPAAIAALTKCDEEHLLSPQHVAATLKFAGFYLPSNKTHLVAYDNLSIEQLWDRALVSAEYTQSAQQLIAAYKLATTLYGERHNIAGLSWLGHGAAVADTLLEFKMDIVTVIAGLFNHITEPEDLEHIATTMGNDDITLRVRDLRKLDIYTSKVTERRDNSLEEISQQLLQICGDPALTTELTNPQKSIKTLIERTLAALKPKQIQTREYDAFQTTVERIIHNTDSTLEAIRRALLSVINNDARIVIVRLAMSLHTLRAAGLPEGEGGVSAETRRRIASDVRTIYAPLANRLGIWKLKWELEDLAFKYLEKEQHDLIRKNLEETRANRSQRVADAIERIESRINRLNSGDASKILPQSVQNKLASIPGFTTELNKDDPSQQFYLDENRLKISAEINGRAKHIYSIYKKMERKNLSFKDVVDALAIRVIIDHDLPEVPHIIQRILRKADGSFAGLAPLTIEELKLFEPIFHSLTFAHCYRVLGFVHHLWLVEPDEYDDYVLNPKANGYRSLHTAVLDKDGYFVEVQIRTRAMHNEAEQGFAAHWAYKEGIKPTAAVSQQLDYLRSALDSGELEARPQSAADKKRQRVFVFTPTDDVMELPKGATPIDFAYAIHSAVGHRTRGAVVGDKMVPLTYQLQSGDQVSINTSSRESIGKPNREWMLPSNGYTVTNRARGRIRRWFRENEREQNTQHGRMAVERELKRLRVSADIDIEEIGKRVLKDEFKNADEFLTDISFGIIRMSQIEGAVALILRDRKVDELPDFEELADDQPLRRPNKGSGKGLQVAGLTGMLTNIAQCCNPIPPEKIIGYVTRTKGVTIHRKSCPSMVKIREKNENLEEEDQSEEFKRIVTASWGTTSGNDKYQIPFRVKAISKASILNDIAKLLGLHNISIIKSKATKLKNHTSIYLLTEVTDLDQATWIKESLEGIDYVFDVRF